MGILRDSKILLASSAYDEPEGLPLPIGADLLSLNAKYTLSTAGGASGGYARLRPMFWVNGAWRRDVQIASLTNGTGTDYTRAAVRMLELDLPVPPADVANLTVSLVVPMGAQQFRCSAAEIGDAAHPGTLALDIVVGRRAS